MTLEQYNQLSYDYMHCTSTHYEKANQYSLSNYYFQIF